MKNSNKKTNDYLMQSDKFKREKQNKKNNRMEKQKKVNFDKKKNKK